MEQRIQKIIASMGIASRRKAEMLILGGRVTVNGSPASLGMKADPVRDHIKVDGKLLHRPEPHVYIILNKPVGVVTSMSDPEGRPTVKDLLQGVSFRVFPAGRLDYDSEGLLIMTNDGALTQSLTHPSMHIPKTYHVKIAGVPTPAEIDALRKGVKLRDGMTAPAGVGVFRKSENSSWLEITLHEGKNRQIRRMLEKVGHDVLRLKRVRVGSLELGDLKSGRYRHLTEQELHELRHETGMRGHF